MDKSYRPRAVSEIVSDLFLQTTTLVRKEVQLARAEMSENVTTVGRGLGMIVGGAVLLIPGLVILLQAAVSVLVEQYGMTTALSALIVGGVVLVLGLILLLIGVNRMKIETIMPNRTVHQLQRDASVANKQVSQDHEQRRAA
jgi:uncharacterized membrane protein YqjE